ncbi:hypothetical protein [Streptomyces beijiangensis]|uniref:Uncharacterized protein n=1 Tax=Streptomyces beijiangensis TaxID=163361 RepID=A0A939F7I2_9ACTN|nr:hypothetical protein [Streptomyces beijiangensis]MBO0513023.1 hypothetical protein [Streptomyces beijiangensis]
MARKPVAWTGAILLFLEALGIAFVNWVLGRVADNQHMSLAGIDPKAISVGAWIMGGLTGIYLVLCGVVLLRMALRDRAPGLPGRILLITCAVVHGVLGALTVGLVGWQAFAFMMLVLGMIVFSLLMYDRENGAPAGPADEAPPAPPASPAPAANGGPSPA